MVLETKGKGNWVTATKYMGKINENTCRGEWLLTLLQIHFAVVSKTVFAICEVPCYHIFNMTIEQKIINVDFL